MTGSSSDVSRASIWRVVRRRQRAVMVSASDTGGLLFGPGGGEPGQGEEHVVERGGVHGESPHRGAQGVKLIEQGPDLTRGPVAIAMVRLAASLAIARPRAARAMLSNAAVSAAS